MAGFGRICSIVGANTNYVNFMTSRNICRNVPLCMTAKERTIEKLGIPPMPKKPLNAFVKFMMSERSKFVEENPKLSATEVVKKLAQRWATYDPKEKEAIQKTVEVELLAYSKKMMMYEQSITPEQRCKLRELRSQKLGKTDKQKMKKKVEELGRPKRPPTGFLQFMMERRFAKEKNIPPLDWLRSLALEWKVMNPEEKAKYQEEVRKLMTRYKADMREWEESMVRQGHLDVVRNRGLIHMKSAKPE